MTDITKQSQVNSFQTTVRDVANGSIVWHTGNTPGTPYGGFASTVPLGGGVPITSNPDVSQLGADIVAGTLASALQSAAQLLSRAKNITYIERFNTNGSYNVVYSGTNITHLNSAYQIGLPNISATYGVTAGNDVSETQLQAFVAQLNNLVTTNRNSTISFQADFCHSNCHSNCHSAGRTRR